MVVKEVENDAKFKEELTAAGAKLVVVDYFATWCGPCRTIAPFVEELSNNYPNAVFLKVDVDKCQGTAAGQGVSAMPTFIFYRGGVKKDLLRGANQGELEEKVKKWYGDGETEAEDSPVKGHIDLTSEINMSGVECLNESDDHPLQHALSNQGGYLASDCDEQLIIALEFRQPVKLHSIRVKAPADSGPKTVKLFINQPRTLDFDDAEGMKCVQDLELTAEDCDTGNVVPLRYVKFQNVQNVTIFVKDNQEGGEVTRIDSLKFFGSTVSSTNMADFKRVAGKKGESH